jgi:transposase
MALTDASGLPLAVCETNPSPYEVTLVEAALAASFLRERPERLIADRAYDSGPLDAELAEKGIELTAPHRRNRKKAKTQDGRKLRRYERRWKIKRLFAWLGNFHRLVVRYERRRELPRLCEAGSLVILLRYL